MRVGIDIGGTKTEAVLLDADGGVLARARMVTGLGGAAVVETATRAVTEVVDQAGLELADVVSVGVGIPGTVDGASGTVAHAVNLGVEDLDLGERLTSALGAPVRIENDVNAAALGAYALLARDHEAPRSMAYLNMGTGLAAGLVIDGTLHRGLIGVAGEIGHIPVYPDGEWCACGQRGCLETVASGGAIARSWPNGSGLPGSDLFLAARSGNVDAIGVRDRFLDGVAAAVRIVILTVDVEAVVLGGGLSALGEELLAGTRGAITAQEAESAFLRSIRAADRLSIIPMEQPIAAIGAAMVGAPSETDLPVAQP